MRPIPNPFGEVTQGLSSRAELRLRILHSEGELCSPVQNAQDTRPEAEKNCQQEDSGSSRTASPVGHRYLVEHSEDRRVLILLDSRQLKFSAELLIDVERDVILVL